jgi:putative DNA primase/helicase
VKQLTGQDQVTARFLFGEWFTFQPEFKIFLATNHKPVIRGTDHAIWRRVRLVPFNITIPAAEQDRELPAKLRTELPGILRWAVDGCLLWQREGLGLPKAVQTATESYRVEMDVLGEFIGDRCIWESGASETAKNLYDAYTAWCEQNGDKPMSHKTFAGSLKERGANGGRTRGTRLYHGIRLRLVTDTPSVTDGDAFFGFLSMNPSHEGSNGKTRHDLSPVTDVSPSEELPAWVTESEE